MATCTAALLAPSLQPCVSACVDGPTIIKRSPRLSWLSAQPDVDLRGRAFFSAASCLSCLSAVVHTPACNSSVTVAVLRLGVLLAQGGDSSRMPSVDSDISFLGNMVARRSAFLLYTMQCTNQQCATVQPARRSACYCRACASLPEWDVFVAFCRRYVPSDLPECWQLEVLFETDCSHYPGSSPAEHATAALPDGAAADGARTDGTTADGAPMDTAFLASCRTAFNTSCCPRWAPPSTAQAHPMSALAEPCGGPTRGTCVGVESWLSAQVSRGWLRQSDPPSCWWPRTYGPARCLCESRFAGPDCGGCAKGLMGPDCETFRPREVRRPFVNVSYEEAVAWAGKIGRTLHSLPSVVTFATENEVELVHELNRAFHGSNWLNHVR